MEHTRGRIGRSDRLARAIAGVWALVTVAALCFSACSFEVGGLLLVDGGSSDSLSSDDLAGTDGPTSSTGFAPAHVAPSHVQEGASSLSGVHDIDTDNLLIDGVTPPPGVVFVPEVSHDAWSVLSVRDFTVGSDILVHGRRSLIVVAVGKVKIDGVIHGEASARTPGPGGQYTGLGHGGDGKNNASADSGGGGGGYGDVGAAGGDSTASTNFEGGGAGAAFTVEISGGSGGGNGSGANGTIPCPANQGWSAGGAGGGVIQLSAKLGIELTDDGGINVGGGGGRGGCKEAASAGGGGGSGGSIWIEAPSIRIIGRLAANGGAGGSGGSNEVINRDDGLDGQDGAVTLNVAAGGPSSGGNSGAGGAGASLLSGAIVGGSAVNGGGGGGGVGRIRIRTRGASAVTAAQTLITPAAVKTVDF